jgi:hypothetical protein
MLIFKETSNGLQIHDLETGEMLRRIYSVGGTIDDVFGSRNSEEVFFVTSSMVNPGTVNVLDVSKDDSSYEVHVQ